MQVLFSVRGHDGDPGEQYHKWVLFKRTEVPWAYISRGDTVAFDAGGEGVTDSVRSVYFGMNEVHVDFDFYNVDHPSIWDEEGGARKYLEKQGFTTWSQSERDQGRTRQVAKRS